MNLAIQGSFEAYVWAALWQLALGGLQSGGPPFNAEAATENWTARIQYAASLMASAVSWVAWGLGVWVGMHYSIAAGVLFAAFSFIVNVLTLIEAHRFNRHVIAFQLLGFLAMPIFAFKTLSALGLFAQ